MKLTEKQATKRAAELKQLLAQYDYEYYIQDKTTVSDAVYDGLKSELKSIEAAYPALVTDDSPTQRVVGTVLKGFSKVTHKYRMISLNDVFSQQDVEAWVRRVQKLVPDQKLEYSAELKMDGLACALVYEDGVLVQAVTRGDGTVGEDVTANVRTIRSVPLTLRHAPGHENFLRGRTEIRGEIIMFKRDFEQLNAKRETEGLAVFANPRNLAAGTIRQLDTRLVAERPLQFRGYDLLRDNPSEVPTYEFAYSTIRALGIACNPEAKVLEDIDSVMQFIKHWESKRHELPFITDGLVIKLNNRQLYAKLGVVGKTPRGAVAYKYPAEEATTIVKDIVISIGRTGAATPVAVFDPVVVAGTTVQHASLHNADEIERKDIRVGDTVVIYKAGDIIPQVSRVITELRPKNSRSFSMLNELERQYPGMEFVRPEGEAVYRLKGASGSVLLRQALEHFASKGALDIDGLGEKNVAALVDAGLVHDLADIYTLTKKQLLELERFAEISASKLISAIADKKHPPLARFVFGLGIRHVGAQTAVDLANTFRRLDSLGTADLDELLAVEGIGDIVAESILLWFDEDENQKLLAKFRKHGVWPEDVKRVGGSLAGKSFVITGTLTSMGRDEAADKIRAFGGVFQSSVGNDTDYLVTGENVGASKLVKARKLGTKIISEKQLLDLLKH